MKDVRSFGQPDDLPHSVEAEQQLLGAVLTNNELYYRVASMVRADHFHDPVHGRIWKHCAGRIEKDHLASPVTLKTDMAGDDGLKELGAGYLAKLAGAAVSSSMIEEYARMVVECAEKRRILDQIRSVDMDLMAGGSVSDAVSSLEVSLYGTEDVGEPRSMSLLKAHTDSVRLMQEVYEGREVSVPTGLNALSEALVLAPKRYTILGGATSMGKTALALWITYAAARAGFGVGFVSLEMPEVDLARRFASIGSKIPYKALDRRVSENTFRAVIDAAKDQEALPVEIFSDRVRDVPAILSEAKRLQRKWKPRGEFQGLKLLVVDYLQLVRGKGESQFVRLSTVANDLKQVAKMLDVHVLALAQIDRKLSSADQHGAARPKLADLRGSGDLENAPDNVIFIHRPEYYLKRQQAPKKDEDRADWEAEISRWAGKAEIIIGKARMGETGAVTVNCDLGTNRFWDEEEVAF